MTFNRPALFRRSGGPFVKSQRFIAKLLYYVQPERTGLIAKLI